MANQIQSWVNRDSWLAQSVERVTLDLRVEGSSPTLGVEITLKIKIKKSLKNTHVYVEF